MIINNCVLKKLLQQWFVLQGDGLSYQCQTNNAQQMNWCVLLKSKKPNQEQSSNCFDFPLLMSFSWHYAFIFFQGGSRIQNSYSQKPFEIKLKSPSSSFTVPKVVLSTTWLLHTGFVWGTCVPRLILLSQDIGEFNIFILTALVNDREGCYSHFQKLGTEAQRRCSPCRAVLLPVPGHSSVNYTSTDLFIY